MDLEAKKWPDAQTDDAVYKVNLGIRAEHTYAL